MKTVDELVSEWHAASQIEQKSGLAWQELALVAKKANEEADRAYYAWLAASDNQRAAFDALVAARQAAFAQPKGDA